MDSKLSRRGVLAGLSALPLASLASGLPRIQNPKPFRVAFLTDMHIIDAPLRSDEGIAHTLAHLAKQTTPTDLLITGGDNLTGTMGRTFDDANAMRRRFERAFLEANKLPTLHCAGNHDHWGWNKPSSRSTGSEPLWGKAFARDMLGLDRLYFSVERGGWKIIVLDSVQPFENSYIGGVDNEQFEWLIQEVKTTQPTLVVTHIPITAISPLIIDARTVDNVHAVPLGSILKNMFDVVRLLDDHDNVKLVLSGHTHFEETITFGGISYVNGGAVSGAWWLTPTANAQRWADRNPGQIPRLSRSLPGYTLVDLFADGRFQCTHVATDWQFGTPQ